MADDRQVERLRVEPRVAVWPVGGDGLGREPEQRLRVAGPRRPGGGEDVAPDALVVEPRHQHLDERVLVDPHMCGRAVAVGRGADDRVLPDLRDQPLHGPHRVGAPGRAPRPAAARQPQRAPRAGGEVGQRRVGAGQLIGAVEHERAQLPRIPEREGLRRVRPVRVPVEVDAADAERTQHGGQILHRLRGVIGVARRPELSSAAGGAGDVAEDVVPERRAVERIRPAGAAQVDQQQIAPGRERPPELDPCRTVGRRREPGAALDREHGRDRWPRAVRSRPALEVDPDRAAVRQRPRERDPHEPADVVCASARARGADDRGRRVRAWGLSGHLSRHGPSLRPTRGRHNENGHGAGTLHVNATRLWHAARPARRRLPVGARHVVAQGQDRPAGRVPARARA